jgi:hypothetical protein
MIKHLITGGCSFSTGKDIHGWTGLLTQYLRNLNSDLTTDHTAEISQGQELIQKKVILSITEALDMGIDPKEIFVSVMWSGTNRKAWYIDNPYVIEKIVDGWRNINSSSDQFIDLKYYHHRGDLYKDDLRTYTTKVAYATYNVKGGWYFTVDGSDCALDGVREFYLLDRFPSGPGKTNISLENIVFLQNFCNSKGIRLLHQTYMCEVYKDLLNNKDHQINRYLFDQLDIENFITCGKMDYTLSLIDLTLDNWYNMSTEEREIVNSQHNLFNLDLFHPSQKAAKLYFENILKPFIERII